MTALFNVKAHVATYDSFAGKYLDTAGKFFDIEYSSDNPDQFVQTVMADYSIEVEIPVTWTKLGTTKYFEVSNDKAIYFSCEKVVEYHEARHKETRRRPRESWGD